MCPLLPYIKLTFLLSSTAAQVIERRDTEWEIDGECERRKLIKRKHIYGGHIWWKLILIYQKRKWNTIAQWKQESEIQSHSGKWNTNTYFEGPVQLHSKTKRYPYQRIQYRENVDIFYISPSVTITRPILHFPIHLTYSHSTHSTLTVGVGVILVSLYCFVTTHCTHHYTTKRWDELVCNIFPRSLTKWFGYFELELFLYMKQWKLRGPPAAFKSRISLALCHFHARRG